MCHEHRAKQSPLEWFPKGWREVVLKQALFGLDLKKKKKKEKIKAKYNPITFVQFL